MATENGKYTVIELSELLGVKRTTVNDWLAKYAVYMDYSVQGKRRIYSDSTLTVLKKIAELRGQGKSSFDIDSTLAKLYAVHPQPEPENVTETAVNDGAGQGASDGEVTETLPQRVDYQSEQAEELLRQFRTMMEKIDRLEAAAAALPPPPEPVKKRSDAWIWAPIILLLIAGIAVISWFGYKELTDLRGENAAREKTLQEQQNALRQQMAENEKQAAAREQLLKDQAVQEKTVRLATEKQLAAEKQLYAEKAAKAQAEFQKQLAEQRLNAEKAAEKYAALQIALKAREEQIKTEKQLAEKQVAAVQKDLQQAIRDLAIAKNSDATRKTNSAAEVKKLQDQIKKLEADAVKSKKDLEQIRKEADAAITARKKAEADAVKARTELKKLKVPAAPAVK